MYLLIYVYVSALIVAYMFAILTHEFDKSTRKGKVLFYLSII